ncbi:hypothetical protein [Pseudovibrio sp. POLY-S9]|uniref:hypothetical protein n=1 Tax=Pseudovibrio sp. POLY-S9 TaxID=1576596 RepID=UPI00070CC28D|nr:hypothetical protein [Pseudovibrio sp. POLY-S9]
MAGAGGGLAIYYDRRLSNLQNDGFVDKDGFYLIGGGNEVITPEIFEYNQAFFKHKWITYDEALGEISKRPSNEAAMKVVYQEMSNELGYDAENYYPYERLQGSSTELIKQDLPPSLKQLLEQIVANFCKFDREYCEIRDISAQL